MPSRSWAASVLALSTGRRLISDLFQRLLLHGRITLSVCGWNVQLNASEYFSLSSNLDTASVDEHSLHSANHMRWKLSM